MSYSTAKGVLSTRTKQHPEGTLAELREQFRKPRVLDTTASQYHGASKRERGDIKKGLDYFVGGALKGRRHDDNVVSRTLITLDIEARDGQAQPPSPQDTFDTLEGLGAEGWVYTSLSHTPAAPRYRVVLPLGDPLEGDDCTAPVLEATTKVAAKKLHLGPWCTAESSVLSQPMYLPAKLKDGVFWEAYSSGKQWRMHRPDGVAEGSAKTDALDAIEAPGDPVLQALRDAGRYIGAAPRHPGMHYIRCPWDADHSTENDSKTVYYEAHHDGNPRPACKCMSTSHDELTHTKLVQWLRDEGHLSAEAVPEVLDDPDTFWASTTIGTFLDTDPTPLEFAVDMLCPLGKVAVLAGPGGVSKSSLALRLLLAASTGSEFGPFRVAAPLRCLYLSYEDDAQTFHLRLRAMYDAPEESPDGLLYDMGLVRRNLHIRAVANEALRWLLVAKEGKWGTPEATERVGWLAALLRANGVRLLVVDPVAYTHHLEESSPPEMAMFMQVMGRLAAEAGCAVLLLHHMQKAAQWASIDDVNAGSLRGASSISDNARSVAVLVSISQKDAALYGLPATHDTVSRFALLKHVKHNYSASLGTHVFERRGALLVPCPEITRLGTAEVQAAKEAERAEAQDRVDMVLSAKLLRLLLAEPGKNTNMVKLDMGHGNGKNAKLLRVCAREGWIEAEPGPNRMQCWSVTKEGAQWLRGQPK